ncbi:hypothetical protein U8C37_06805 [Sinorhizobium medicae]|uniref:hypothetical protein n=1 Tax=Sinorhizobium medicae TaxID=110321 RepID=UPI002AF6B942|nr:hypothetical protein [Sinorhizobium medicae]WQO87078.1 hypothetical protein U8C37_06805 [Sinorhizobium medicae]
MTDRITMFRDTLGAAESYLHAIKMAIGSARGMTGRDKDTCALNLLVDAAQREISEAHNIVDDMESAGPEIERAIDRHRRAHDMWAATARPNGDLVAEGPDYDRFVAAELDFIAARCSTPEDVQRKLAYVAECRLVAEAIQAETSYQSLFLDSLSLRPVDKQAVNDVDIGEN